MKCPVCGSKCVLRDRDDSGEYSYECVDCSYEFLAEE